MVKIIKLINKLFRDKHNAGYKEEKKRKVVIYLGYIMRK